MDADDKTPVRHQRQDLPPRPVLPDRAAAHRRGPAAAVEAQWESLRLVWEWRQAAHRIRRPGGPFPVLLPLLEAAGAQPRLRRLYPFTSHSILRFSSSTTFPWTVQGGSVEPLYDGRFRVRRAGPHAVIGEVDSPEEAVALVLELLPEEDPVITAPEGFRAGHTGLIVRIPEAEPVVGTWRERLDPSARAGVPAHVTVLFPFLDESRIDTSVHAAIADVVGAHRAFDLRFERCGHLPEVLYLAPEPDTHLRQLTQAVAARWPEAPPYGGRFADVVPHLTVAQRQASAVRDEVEADLRGRLPFSAHVSSVDLMVHDGTRWQHRASFPLGT
ncbi:DUF6193 family natural product biosynthesis protein [Streptomyces sp. NPDC093224]|uniref:DUF6193 family natural product biosynthesis protein n=1 Tax=Streptomyces sp. NPDC093224 TaxID=3155198 RepID=UPI00341F7D08